MGSHSLLQGIFPTQGWNPEYLALPMGNLVIRNVFFLLSGGRLPAGHRLLSVKAQCPFVHMTVLPVTFQLWLRALVLLRENA